MNKIRRERYWNKSKLEILHDPDREKFILDQWDTSQNGNLKRKMKDGTIFVVRQGPKGGWCCSYFHPGKQGWIPIPGWFDYPRDAKAAGYDIVYG
jgi:hypothetical protein